MNGTRCRHRGAVVAGEWWARYRKQVHAAGTGRVLEIGAPAELAYHRARFVAVVPARREPVAACGDAFEVADVRPDRLPYPSGAFDVVVCTLSLCCAENPGGVVAEIGRVLRPHGHVEFLEHSRAGVLGEVRHRVTTIAGRDRCRIHTEPLALLLRGGFVLRRADIVPSDASMPLPLVGGVATLPAADVARDLGHLLGNRSP